MKKIYTLVILAISSLAANAQDFSYPIGQHLYEDVDNENFVGYQIDINTPAPEAIQYKWELVSNTFPSGWSYSLCDYGGCSIGIPPSGTMTAITMSDAQNGVIGWFKIQLTVGQNAGTGTVQIYVYDSNDYNRGDTVSWNLSWDPTTASLTAETTDEFMIYPNPADTKVTVSGAGKYNGAIYNNVGQKVITLNADGNDTIDVSNLPAGVYTVMLSTEEGILSERLIIE